MIQMVYVALILTGAVLASLGCDESFLSCEEIGERFSESGEAHEIPEQCQGELGHAIELDPVKRDGVAYDLGEVRLAPSQQHRLSEQLRIEFPESMSIECFFGINPHVPTVKLVGQSGIRQPLLNYGRGESTLVSTPDDWRLLPGTTDVESCDKSIDIDESFESKTVKVSYGLVHINSQSAGLLDAPHASEAIVDYWVNADASYLRGVTVTAQEIGFLLEANRTATLNIRTLLEEGSWDLRILDVGRAGDPANRHSPAWTQPILLHAASGGRAFLIALNLDVTVARLVASVHPAPSEWGAEVQRIGALGLFAIVSTDVGVVLVRNDARSWFRLLDEDGSAFPVDRALVSKGRTTIVSDVVWQVETRSLIGPVFEASLRGEKTEISIPAIEIIEGLSDIPQTYWVDGLGQVWSKRSAGLSVSTAVTRTVSQFNPIDGHLYLHKPRLIHELKVISAADANEIELERGSGSVDIRSTITESDFPSAKLTLRYETETVTIPISSASLWGRPIVPSAAARPGKGSEGDVNAPTYTRNVEPLLAEFCFGGGCHSGANPAGGLNLANRIALTDNFDRVVDVVGPGGSMPIGRPKLSKKDIETLRQWQTGGYLE